MDALDGPPGPASARAAAASREARGPAPRGPAAGSERAELRAALALAGVEGLGPARGRALLDRFGSPLALLEALGRSGGAGLRGLGLTRPVADGLAGLRPVPGTRLSGLEAAGVRVVRYGGPGYPERLGHLHHPPLVLYLTGPLGLPEARAVAIVGTRRSTQYGRRVTRDLAGALAAAGWWVVSGMARGIDGAAHRAALEAGGSTVGVVAGGVDVEYPSVHRALFRDLRERGVLVSEFPPGTRPEAGLFPRRNRIIAALADLVVVVQAGPKSGALLTVEHALDLNREVGAVPGPVGPAVSEGVHDLLRDGAAPITSADDVLELLGEGAPGASGDPGPDGEPGPGRLPCAALPFLAGVEEPALRVWAEAEAEARAGDDLAEASGLGFEEGRTLLDRMELAGLLDRLPGDRYERRHGRCSR
ncbi:MAG TPA: DNA-processing protein DprA [Gemmatimonadota bacterium]|nr:DNA-processing protein DprA [Gemmatimonadota bacterium]